MNFSNTSYIIMGGTTGLGFSVAQALVKNDARVLVVGRDESSCQEAADHLGDQGEVLCADATQPGTIQSAVARAEERFGSLYGLFHVAGGSGRSFGDGPLHEMTLEGWNKTLELNLTSLMLSNQGMVKYFRERKIPGTILNMGSVLGYSPSPKYFLTHAYAASKAAVIGFSQSIAAAYAADNIRINVLAPALMATPMAQRAMEDNSIQQFLKTKQPLDGGRAGMPEDINEAAMLFLSPQSPFITGQVLAVDGGWSISEGQYQ